MIVIVILSVHVAKPCMVLGESVVDVYDLCKSSADFVLTSCSGQRNELIS